MEATHTLEDEFRPPDRDRAHVVEAMISEGLTLVDDLHHGGAPSQVVEDLLLDIHASSRDQRSFESWCQQALPPGPRLREGRPQAHPVGLKAAGV